MDLVRRYLPGSFRPSGAGNWQTTCPFHKGGQERTPSFSIHPEKGTWHCFTCHEAGTLKNLLFRLNVPRATIDAELKFIQPILDAQRANWKIEKDNTFQKGNPFKADYVLPEAILGAYDYCPYGLVTKGFDPSLLQRLQIGFDPYNQRITYPLRDMYGDLAGIVGGKTLDWQQPKYKVYEGSKKIGNQVKAGDFGQWFDGEFPTYRCENHDFLWNYHEVYPRVAGVSDPDATVFIVEGFKACMWMLQCGYLNTVALMGSYLSERQRQMLEWLGVNIYLFLDNDEAGRRATLKVGHLLKRPMNWRIRVVTYPPGHDRTQPDNYTQEWLNWMIGNSRSFLEYLNDRSRLNG